MGFFDKLKREIYINKLVTAYKMTYECGDYAAMECLTKNYSTKELKEIYGFLRDAKKSGLLLTMILAPQFKENFRDVTEIDKKYNGN
ncbi:MAG: hypothetical protein OES39_07490 [Desulfobulbaceae bacterium]|jgi:hypothetical protein|nr:hypothetical protein [Desulfobulbaceae bacterium]MDH3781102.1 hypothetical protein [Desulfobulbaceae bacterium]MDH3866922.1 hypothetical protein [Desulfobulbaceae bacterium]MDH3996711.1 hypothetical protein [Desulfobulbaceae bacterium]HKJ13295.1 hypothetical protein [Desulfobulbales bacterium]